MTGVYLTNTVTDFLGAGTDSFTVQVAAVRKETV